MRRRDFITLVGSAAAMPLAAHAQQPNQMRRISMLTGVGEDDAPQQVRRAAFLEALQQLGWTDGRNVRIDFRWGGGDIEKDSQIRVGTGRARARRHLRHWRSACGAVA
jgi:putative ABC transport system substrate-binding protein